MALIGGKFKVWSNEEKEILRLGYEAKLTAAQISAQLPGRTVTAVRRFRNKAICKMDPSFIVAHRAIEIPDFVLDDRDARANEPRTITMEFFGDPPPSRSALGRLCP